MTFRHTMPRMLVVALALIAALLTMAPLADAHPKTVSVLKLELADDAVRGQFELPVEGMEDVLDATFAAWKNGPLPAAQAEPVRQYLQGRLDVRFADGGAPWTVRVGDVIAREGSSAKLPDLIADVTLEPPAGAAMGAFTLGSRALLEDIPAHRTFVRIISDWDSGAFPSHPKQVGILSESSPEITIGDSGNWRTGFFAVLWLGTEHIGEGADHVLFLMMLLLIAPLVAIRRRWVASDSLRSSVWRVVKIATAFTIGHSLTLIIVGLEWVSLPARPVEILIGLSVAVSAVHAMRPLVPGGETWIAGGFGLVHGLAFGTLLLDIGVDGGNLIASLIAFNLGVEVAQLLIIALVVPSLWLMSRTRYYTPFRWAVATFGLIASLAWVIERTFETSNPIEWATEFVPAHLFLSALAIALVAIAARIAADLRGEPPVRTVHEDGRFHLGSHAVDAEGDRAL